MTMHNRADIEHPASAAKNKGAADRLGSGLSHRPAPPAGARRPHPLTGGTRRMASRARRPAILRLPIG